jgi:hypothetical protein
MKSAWRLRPGVDFLVKLRDKSAGEDLGTLPPGACIDPRLPGGCEIVSDCALVQTPRARQRTCDVFDEDGPVALDGIVERRAGGDAFDGDDSRAKQLRPPQRRSRNQNGTVDEISA